MFAAVHAFFNTIFAGTLAFAKSLGESAKPVTNEFNMSHMATRTVQRCVTRCKRKA